MRTFCLRPSIVRGPRVSSDVLCNVYDQETLFLRGRPSRNCEVGSQITQAGDNLGSPPAQPRGQVGSVPDVKVLRGDADLFQEFVDCHL